MLIDFFKRADLYSLFLFLVEQDNLLKSTIKV